MSTAAVQTDACLVELRQQAHYWRALHARAVEREKVLKQQVVDLQQTVREKDSQIAELTGQLEAVRARLSTVQQLAFGSKCDQAAAGPAHAVPGDRDGQDVDRASEPSTGKRGQRPGAKGHGRKRREQLETEVVSHALPVGQQCCPKCGKPFEEFPGAEDCEELVLRGEATSRSSNRLGGPPGPSTIPCANTSAANSRHHPDNVSGGICHLTQWHTIRPFSAGSR